MKQVYFFNYKNKLSPKEIFNQLVSELLINTDILNLTSFDSIFTYICMCGSEFRIRTQEAPEYGSHTDPDPQH